MKLEENLNFCDVIRATLQQGFTFADAYKKTGEEIGENKGILYFGATMVETVKLVGYAAILSHYL